MQPHLSLDTEAPRLESLAVLAGAGKRAKIKRENGFQAITAEGLSFWSNGSRNKIQR